MDAPFDTMATMRLLRESGLTECQTTAIKDGVTGGVATKADIAELRTGLRWVPGIGAGIFAILIGAVGFGFSMPVDMTAGTATLQTTLAAQNADITSIKEALVALDSGD